MKSLATALLILTAAVSAPAAEIGGAWTADANDQPANTLHLQLSRKHSNTGRTMSTGSLSGLSANQIFAASQIPVNFALRTEPGTVSFEGTFRKGLGAGQFSFTPNPAFLDSVRALGVPISSNQKKPKKERDPDERLLHYAVGDLSTAFIRSMQAVGYNVSLDEYFQFRLFNVTPDLVRELAGLGYRDIAAGDLVASQIHGVTVAYIREMNAAGFRSLSLQDLVATRIHQVTPEFARDMSQLGYADLALDDLTAFRIHGVTADFIRQLRELGYDKVPAGKLVAMRIHGVTAEFIKQLEGAGYRKVPVDKLISMRIHGIDAEFVKKMNEM